MRNHISADALRQQAAPRGRVAAPARRPGAVSPSSPLDARSILGLQRTMGNSATVIVMREFLPVGRHREVVVDAAKRLGKRLPAASDKEWIKAIYAELEGTGNPAADKCADQLIQQSIIDAADWNRIEAEFKLFKKTSGKGFDLFERHSMPRMHSEEEADKWVSSLITHRIGDLYSTVPGFIGHAQQVQLGINQVVAAYGAGMFPPAAFARYKERIIGALETGRNTAKLPIPRYVYAFEGDSTTSIG